MTVSDPLRPNATITNQWSLGDHTDVDEEVTQPALGNGDFWTASDPGGDDNEIIVMGFPNTITDVDEVTNITVWTWGAHLGANTPEIDINMGGWLEEWQECSFGQTGTWTSDGWNGSWTQANLDGLQVKYRADVPTKSASNQLDVIYVIVTYTTTAGGYSHKFCGVLPANIGKISGVATASIGKVKGV